MIQAPLSDWAVRREAHGKGRLKMVHIALVRRSCTRPGDAVHRRRQARRHTVAHTVAYSCVCATVLLFAFVTQRLRAQNVVMVPDHLACPECSIDIEHVMELGGEQDTIGIGYTGQLPLDSRGRVYFYPYEWPGAITVFGADGSALTSIGQVGQGPGEFRGTTGVYVAPGDSIYAFDGGLDRLTVYSPDYELARTSQVEMAATGDVYFRRDGRLVIATIARGRSTYGYPLHVLTPTGQWEKSFGGDYSHVSQRNQLLLRRRIAPSADGGSWAAHAFNYDIEYHDPDGHLVTALRRRPTWFPEVRSVPYRPLEPSDDPPYAMVTGIQEDLDGYLWVLSWVAATDWLDALARQHPRSPTTTGFWDTVIEVVDPSTERVVTRTMVPDRALGFSGRRTFYTYNDEGVFPRIDVWRLRLIRNER